MSENGMPRFVKLIAVGVIVGLVIVLAAAWQISDIRGDEERRDCERAIAGRADNRAMWLWLAELFPAGEIEIDLKGELNERLPELYCDGVTPTPVEEEN